MKDASFTFTVVENEGKRGPKLNSMAYWLTYFRKFTNIGDKGTITISFKKRTRSENQLDYYFVLCSLIGDYNGNTKEEVHDILATIKWGVKEVKLLGRTFYVRRSISNASKMNMTDMGELMTLALETCAELNIHVPTREEIGYGPR